MVPRKLYKAALQGRSPLGTVLPTQSSQSHDEVKVSHCWGGGRSHRSHLSRGFTGQPSPVLSLHHHGLPMFFRTQLFHYIQERNGTMHSPFARCFAISVGFTFSSNILQKALDDRGPVAVVSK